MSKLKKFFHSSIENFEIDSEKLLSFFHVLGYFAANTTIPLDVLIDTSGLDENVVRLYINELAKLGLVRNIDDLSFNPLIKELALLTDKESEGRTIYQFITTINELSTKVNETRMPNRMQPLYPHLLSIGELAEKRGITDIGCIWFNVGSYEWTTADYESAQSHFERALTSDEQKGNENQDVSRDLNGLALVYYAKGNLSLALKTINRAIGIDEKLGGKQHKNYIRDINNLGLIMAAQGNLGELIKLYDDLLKNNGKSYFLEKEIEASITHNLGLYYLIKNNLPMAKENLEKSLTLDQSIFGNEHPNVARDFNHLGLLYLAQKDFTVAKSFLEHAYEIDKSVLGNIHPSVARDLSNLGKIMVTQENYEAAVSFYERALDIDEKVYGTMNNQIIEDLNILEMIYRKLDRLEDARSCITRAAEISSITGFQQK